MMLVGVQRACSILDEYLSAHDLCLNVPKTQCLIFGNKTNSSLSFSYKNTNIETAENLSFLGVKIDRRLDWRAHVEDVALSISKYCYALRVIRNEVGLEGALLAYHAFIQPE